MLDDHLSRQFDRPGRQRPIESGDRQVRVRPNRAALRTYGGTTMDDPTLLQRLPAISTPTLVVWGEADRIIPPGHGDAYARAIPVRSSS